MLAKFLPGAAAFVMVQPYNRNWCMCSRAAASILFLVVVNLACGECLPFSQAPKNVGATKCITGQVLKVTRGASGTFFLNFCPDYRVCSFQVVVFPRDLRHVGDIRALEGKTIEINGTIKEFDGRPEIVLKNVRQLRGDAARIPPLPKKFDVENKGRYSAGKFSYPKSSRKKSPKRQTKPIETEDPAESLSEE
jgi:hypothetical protein